PFLQVVERRLVRRYSVAGGGEQPAREGRPRRGRDLEAETRVPVLPRPGQPRGRRGQERALLFDGSVAVMHLPRGLPERKAITQVARLGAAGRDVEAIVPALDGAPGPPILDLGIADERPHARVERQLAAEARAERRVDAQLLG